MINLDQNETVFILKKNGTLIIGLVDDEDGDETEIETSLAELIADYIDERRWHKGEPPGQFPPQEAPDFEALASLLRTLANQLSEAAEEASRSTLFQKEETE